LTPFAAVRYDYPVILGSTSLARCATAVVLAALLCGGAAAAGARAESEFDRATEGWALTSGAATPTVEAGRHVDVVSAKTLTGARTRTVGDGPWPAAVVGWTPGPFVEARRSSAAGAIADGRGTYLRHSVLLI
jgi:hypothetical protein